MSDEVEVPAAVSTPQPQRPRRRRRTSRPKAADTSQTAQAPNGEQEPKAESPPAETAEQNSTRAATPAQGSTQAEPRQSKRRRRSPRRVRPPALGSAKARTMLISAGHNRNQIGVLEDRELVEHYVARDEDRSIVGNIYLGRVQNVLPGMEAAFLDIGEARNAVLYAGELSFDEELEGPAPRIESLLKSGQSVLAQVVKDPMGSKGARLTTEVSIAGRHLVLVPSADSLGISRRLPDNERKRLRDLASKMRPEGAGLIVRTAADGAEADSLERDVNRLNRIWKDIEQKRKRAKPPKLLYSEPELSIRVVRDLFTTDVVKVLVDNAAVFEQIHEYIAEVTPDLAARIELYEDPLPLFERYHVVEQLRKAIDRKVWLKSGGHIVIDRTEAMTVIDVNTGRFVGKSNLEETVLHANLEAAEEIAKQLRLRDIGGIVVIDFIDMMYVRNRDQLVKVFTNALAMDKTRTQVFGISEVGLLQMTRKNVSEGLIEAFSHPCEACEGRGVVLTDLE